MIKPIAVVIHHEAGYTGLQAVNELHRQRFDFKSSLGFYVGYQYYCDTKGVMTQTRSETEEGAHTLGGWNQKSIGICLMGNFETGTPTKPQLDALSELLGEIRLRHGTSLDKIYYHGELWQTLCPGRNLKSWVVSYRKADLEEAPEITLTPEADLKEKITLLQQLLTLYQKLLELMKGRK